MVVPSSSNLWRSGTIALPKKAPRQTKAVAVDAVAAHADDDVAFGDALAGHDLVEVDAPDRHADEVEALDDVFQLRGLAAGNRNPRHLGAGAQARADRVEHGGVGALDRDVVDQRDRLRADADHVVDVHRDAIDADGVVFAHHVGDDGLRADAVGAERDADAVHLDHIGEIADRQRDAPLPGARPGALHSRDDVGEPGFGFVGVDAALAVGFLALVHRPLFTSPIGRGRIAGLIRVVRTSKSVLPSHREREHTVRAATSNPKTDSLYHAAARGCHRPRRAIPSRNEDNSS